MDDAPARDAGEGAGSRRPAFGWRGHIRPAVAPKERRAGGRRAAREAAASHSLDSRPPPSAKTRRGAAFGARFARAAHSHDCCRSSSSRAALDAAAGSVSRQPMADTAMEEAAPLMGGSPSLKRRSRWQAAAAAAAATLGVVALARGGRTAPTGAAGARQCSTDGKYRPRTARTSSRPRGARKPWRWATSASGRLWLLARLTWTRRPTPCGGATT